MSAAKTVPVLLIPKPRWLLSGNSIGFHCPDCGAMIWTFKGLLNEHGVPRLSRVCQAENCDWRGKVRFEGWEP